MKYLVSDSKCTGQGRCYSLAARLFEADDDGLASIRDVAVEVDPALNSLAEDAALNCPEQAISLQK
jgi:ferredoxin